GQVYARLVQAINEQVELSIYDVQGKLVKQQSLNNADLSAQVIDINALNAGMYFVSIKAGDKIYSSKLQIN
ncbi:MAG: T9SS type A sorting domain-containing protein, partial [Bacteroidia bacterium]